MQFLSERNVQRAEHDCMDRWTN